MKQYEAPVFQFQKVIMRDVLTSSPASDTDNRFTPIEDFTDYEPEDDW